MGSSLMLGGKDRMAWNRRSSRFEAVLPGSSDKEKRGHSTSGSTSLQLHLPGRALAKVARWLLLLVASLVSLLFVLHQLSGTPEATGQPTSLESGDPVGFFKSRWSSPSGTRPAEWAIKAAEAILPDVRASVAEWERERLLDLARILECRANNNCTKKQKHVVISGVGRWKWSLDETFERPAFFPNGEAVLGKSWISTIKEMGYPFIHIADYWGGDDSVRTISRLYRAIGDNVAVVLFDYVSERVCTQEDKLCKQSEENPEGIPEWKIFQWDPLGAVPEPKYREPWGLKTFPIWPGAKVTYVGFEMESSCAGIPFTPPDQRENMIYVFGKEKFYFDPERNHNAWENSTYQRIIRETGVRIEAGILDNDPESRIPDGVTNVGTETRGDFMRRIARAKLLMGTGLPHESPTPMEGLCAGTPFINMELNPGWHQHPMLAREAPPHVYSVPARDEDKLLVAVQKALASPLQKPFLPELATKKSFKGRLQKLINDDWKTRWETARLEDA